MALLGEDEPSTVPWMREEVEHLQRTGQGLRGRRAVVLLTTVGARSGKLRKTPLMRVSGGAAPEGRRRMRLAAGPTGSDKSARAVPGRTCRNSVRCLGTSSAAQTAVTS
ncbi:nitroreductase/quinone reductase family protein [Blastococcus goldschmidtiae]|uniref:Nitroreductase/quinone reductase family protein n=1 Tax=Blastococcus goldschmidtiae TaxID=3075546 RepID=A0ABU2K5E5_9ACTN|nr:nitroreductase/quinone reductase family protein [Blastococcus sp. DSM 46792]MDT0275415.1 nitroreductase/quinone reductase family protein [Blastococcus sp. DSM 46792]